MAAAAQTTQACCGGCTSLLLSARPQTHARPDTYETYMVAKKGMIDPELDTKHRVLSVDDALLSLQENGTGWWTYLCVNTLCINVAMQAVEYNVLIYLSSCSAGEWQLSNAEASILASTVYLGMGIGSLVLCPIADVFGRWAVLFFSTVGLVLFGLLSAVAPTYFCLCFCRFFVGFCEGPYVVALDLLLEYVPADKRGVMGNITNVAWGVGSTLVCIIAYCIIPHLGWRWFLAVSTIPFAYNLLQLWQLVESPRWLLEEGESEKALAALAHIAKMNGCRMPCDEVTLGEQAEETPLVPHKRSSQIFAEEGYAPLIRRLLNQYKELFDRKLLKTSIPVFIAFICMYFVYAGITLFDGDILGGHEGFGSCQFNYQFQIIVTSSTIFGPALFFWSIDRTDMGYFGGRRGSQCVTYVSACVALVAPAIVGPSIEWAFVARGMITAGTGILGIHCAEVFDTMHRATGCGLASVLGSIAASFCAFWVLAPFTPLVIAGGLCFLTAVALVCILCLDETAGKELC